MHLYARNDLTPVTTEWVRNLVMSLLPPNIVVISPSELMFQRYLRPEMRQLDEVWNFRRRLEVGKTHGDYENSARFGDVVIPT